MSDTKFDASTTHEKRGGDDDLHHHHHHDLPPDVLFREAQIPTWRWAAVCTAVCLGLFMAMIDSSIVATSLYTIGTEFADFATINWIALAYTLAFLGCSVFFARMCDVVGRRDAFIAAFVIFFSFSLGAGFSRNMAAVVVCRAFQGIGGSGLFSVTMVIIPEITPQHLKTRAVSLIGATISTSGVLGPILGGAFTEYTTWRWVFWIK